MREDGQEHTTPVVEVAGPCQWCKAAMVKHAAGRRPKFCSPSCRVARHRAEKRVERAYRALLDAEEALRRGGTT